MPLRLALAQVNPTVGALSENRRLLEERCAEARAAGARVVVFPELVLTGYPPEDLLTNPEFVAEAEAELRAFAPASRGLLVLVGAPLRQGEDLRNAAALFLDGVWVDTYAKGSLPNYGVFDEKRYFRPGLRCPVYRWDGLRFGVNICEDLWVPGGIPRIQAEGGAQLLLNLSSSPYHAGKGRVREFLLRRRARAFRCAIALTNLVGGQDELVFDGESLVVDAAGTVRARAPQFEEALMLVDLEESWWDARAGRAEGEQRTPDKEKNGPEADPGQDEGATEQPREDAIDAEEEPQSESVAELEGQFFLDEMDLGTGLSADLRSTARPAPAADFRKDSAARTAAGAGPGGTASSPHRVPSPGSRLSPDAEIYRALTLGLGDYVRKNRFRNVVIGLSGGIDSALTAVLAADALGRDCVTGVSMPSRYNSPTSRQGARDVAVNLGIRFLEIPIEKIYHAFLDTLASPFADAAADVAEENVQARIRGTLLMALSNKWGSLVLTTGNKSELAVGYCTLYGDMAGGFAVIKDVPKTLVYRLARYRNSLAPVIPEDTITRPPSAELRENQCDQDLLPPYELLDAIVEARMEREEGPEALIARGLDPRWVLTVYRWIDANEYKRRQAPPGIKITPRAFGRDRRYPITNRHRWEARV